MKDADFSGFATVHGLKCSDGRTILPDAFKHMDGAKVPLVWQHQHSDPENILGHALLENRAEGVYAYGFFNSTPKGAASKAMVSHKDITSLSIYANRLVERDKNVSHGDIKEVSLVIAGANPGAQIDNVYLRHSDDEVEVLEDEAIITTGREFDIEHADAENDAQKDSGGTTVQDVFDTLSQEQKDVVYYMIEQALVKQPDDATKNEAAAAHGDGEVNTTDNADDNGITHSQEGSEMTRNVFEQNKTDGSETQGSARLTLSHDDMKGIIAATQRGGTLRQAVEDYALAHGINDIDVLFPDAKTITSTPEFIKRRTEWVAGVLNGCRHTPFSRVKSMYADITEDEARAKGYVKGEFKKEEFFSLSKRVTTPTTIYKKQKLDRDDIIDITDFDVIAWMKAEMRLMLEEELARAILIGDGREASDSDKIKDPGGTVTEGAGIRSILHDNELYATTVTVNVDDANSNQIELVDAIVGGMQYYKGSGSPTFYTTLPTLTRILLQRDSLNRRIWKSAADLASELMVSSIVTVEVMEAETDLIGIIVNLDDYNIGADRGGEVSLFDDFDIDYNQQKYLIETRASGALVKLKAAVIVKKTAAANVLATPSAPTFVSSTGVVTIPAVTGVVYQDEAGDTLTAGAQTALSAGESMIVHAEPASGYYFATNANDDWIFTRPSA